MVDQPFVTFELDESLILKKGQEIAEVMSIALEPEFVVHEEADEIVITGSIFVQGEYEVVRQEHAMDYQDSFSHFSHAFPLNIVLPIDKVVAKESLHVSIASFDYVLPDPQTVQVTASLKLYGVDAETVTVTHPVQDKEVKDEQLSSVEESVEMEEDAVIDKEEATEKEAALPIVQYDPQVEDAPEETSELLQSLFHWKQEEAQATMRLYVVQQDDSLEKIAKKYQLSPLAILKVNELNGETIETGQLLKIPM